MLIKGDCLQEMKTLEKDSVDLLFCDLPWNATSCKWDCALDLSIFWKEVNRICKINAPMFFCCNVKFGNTLINSNSKNFRYDIVWIKSSPVGFLNAKKMPMKKHEMIYVFYRKLPFYDLSSHSHKFLGEKVSNRTGKDGVDNKSVWKNRSKSGKEISNKYDPPLPTSIIKDDKEYCKYDINKNCYGGGKDNRIKISKNKEDHCIKYDPPLPTSIVKEKQIRNTPKLQEGYGKEYLEKKPNYRLINPNLGANGTDCHIYDPPLPNSILEIKSEKGKHATQKPIAMIEWILKYYSKEGDLVLDPTMGSGSSGVACKNMNRKYIGIEKDEEIFKIAVERNNCHTFL